MPSVYKRIIYLLKLLKVSRYKCFVIKKFWKLCKKSSYYVEWLFSYSDLRFSKCFSCRVPLVIFSSFLMELRPHSSLQVSLQKGIASRPSIKVIPTAGVKENLIFAKSEISGWRPLRGWSPDDSEDVAPGGRARGAGTVSIAPKIPTGSRPGSSAN